MSRQQHMPCSMLLPPRIWLSQGFASQAKKRPSRLPTNTTISLDHFLQRGRALALWRRIVRDTRRIPDKNTREEMLRMARDEFRRNKGVTDITQIRYLISTGKTQWDGMERYIDGI